VGIAGAPGAPGSPGEPGEKGDTGGVGPAGTQVAAEFYGLGSSYVPIDGAVRFDFEGPSTNDDIIHRVTYDTFAVTTSGLYRISFRVPIDEAGTLLVTVNDVNVDYTSTGRSTGTTPIIGESLVQLDAGSHIRIVNRFSPSALTISNYAGGYGLTVASLVIELVEAADVAVGAG
jgi:hypothetical protein